MPGGGNWAADEAGGPLKLKNRSVTAVPYNKVIKRLEGGPDEALHPYAVAFLDHARREAEAAEAAEAARPGGLMGRLLRWAGA